MWHQVEGKWFWVDKAGHVSVWNAQSLVLQPVAEGTAQLIQNSLKQRLEYEELVRRQQQQNQPLDNRGQLKQKVSQANADYSRQLREHRANKGNYTPEEYQRIREDIMAEWEEVKGMLQETHGYAQKEQNTGLNSGQIELALSKTPIPGEPQKKKFSNTSYRPQKNIYA